MKKIALGVLLGMVCMGSAMAVTQVTVKSGDSCWKIAKNTHSTSLTVRKMTETCKVLYPKLKAGQVISLPSSQTEAATMLDGALRPKAAPVVPVPNTSEGILPPTKKGAEVGPDASQLSPA